MEFLNRIEILGTVGNVRVHEVGDSRVARVSVATDYSFKDRSGAIVIDTTWHSVTIWARKDDKEDISNIRTGCHLYVLGRIRQSRYTDVLGKEHTVSEIIAQSWQIK